MEPEGSLPHYKCPPPVPILSQINPAHTPLPTSWRSILILSSHLRLGLPSGLFPTGFPTKTLYAPFDLPIRATCIVHLILLYLITGIIFGDEYRSLSSLCSFLHSPVTSSLLRPKNPPQHPFLIHLHPAFLNVSDQVSHPSKTTGTIVVLYVLSLYIRIANWKTKDSAANYIKHSLTSVCT